MTLQTERLAKRASQLKIAAISLAEDMRNGGFRSLYRGQGIEFSDVRDYLPGDNVRSIDWNVTARMGKTFIKQYEEDKEISVFIILDCSASMESSFGGKSKLNQAAEAAALLLLSCQQNSGAIGCVFFDGAIRFSCPPKSGQKNAMIILSKLDKISLTPEEEKKAGSVLDSALKGASRLLKKRSLVFVISDWRSRGWEKSLASLAQKHDLVPVKITSPTDSQIPDLGTLPFYDPESKKIALFPTLSKKFKSEWKGQNQSKTNYWKEICSRHAAYPLEISTEEDCAAAFSRFFSQRFAK